MATKTLDQHIEITPGVVGGKPRIAGRRITVRDVAVWHERMSGNSPSGTWRIPMQHVTDRDILKSQMQGQWEKLSENVCDSRCQHQVTLGHEGSRKWRVLRLTL